MADRETFKISAALKDIIGKELITDDFVAVFELVKNSFDANASKVEVIFENNHDPDNARIIIKDNGKGMNYDDLKNKWLFVAYSAKRLGKENDDYRNKIKTRRIFSGAKGVGRFSCDRLGKHLNLISLKDEKDAIFQNLSVNWENFENVDDKEFINVSVTHKTLTKNDLTKIDYRLERGTVLEISGLRDLWDRERILKLKKSLAKLINPNQGNDSQNFSIKIIAADERSVDGKKKNKFDVVNGFVENAIFETLEIKTSNIFVKISPDGDFVETVLQDRGDKIYYLKEKNPYSNLQNISIYLFQLNRSAKTEFTKRMGIEAVRYGSVFVYKNGFRVYPFGEEGEDILGIDRRKQQGYKRFLGTRDLIGRIEINGEQPELRETTSRDGGLVKTHAYRDLVDFFNEYVLKRLENYVVNIIQWGDERVNRETGETTPELWAKDVKIQILELITGFINSKNIIDVQYDKDFLKIVSEKQDRSVNKIIKNISKVAEKSGNAELVKEAKKIEKVVLQTKADATVALEKAAKEEILRKETDKELEREKNQGMFFRSIIGREKEQYLGLLHQVRHSSSRITTKVKLLLKHISKSNIDDDIKECISVISSESAHIASLSKFITYANYDLKADKIEADIIQFVSEYVEKIYLANPPILKSSLTVKVNFSEKSKHNIEFRPLEMVTLIDNFIQNAEKAGAKSVSFNFETFGKRLIINISDNGKGIPRENIKHVFDLGFTTTGGSGIGLFSVKSVIQEMKGKIDVSSEISKGTTFKIEL